MNTKICTGCKINKIFSEFDKSKKGKNGLSSKCKVCISEYQRKRYEENKEELQVRAKISREKNKEKMLIRRKKDKKKKAEYDKEYQKKHKERIDTNRKKYEKNNREKILENKKTYYKENKEYFVQYAIDNEEKIALSRKKRRERRSEEEKKAERERDRKYTQERVSTDPEYKLRRSLRRRLNMAVRNEFKSGSAVFDLGCSIEDFKKYIESLWQPGMSWDNYSREGWHLDHKKPLSSFNLSNREQLLIACHYTNIQPLWAIDNLKKGDKL